MLIKFSLIKKYEDVKTKSGSLRYRQIFFTLNMHINLAYISSSRIMACYAVLTLAVKVERDEIPAK